jgi:flagellar export protein FliJ
MQRNTLATLIRLRQRALDDSRRALASRLEVEGAAKQATEHIEHSIAREREAALDPASPDHAVEAFARWLPSARTRLAEAHDKLQLRQAETACARAHLAACRTALESVETLQRERRERVAQVRERRLQRELDDHAARRPNSN